MLEITWPEAKEIIQKEKIAIIPIGSCEQHGPHAPLGTDFIIAKELGQEIASRENVLSTPAIPVGVSAHHRHFWGTLWTSPETFKNYIKDVVRSLGYHGVEKVVFVNGHGGNHEPLREVASAIRKQEEIYCLEWTWFLSVEELIGELFEGRALRHADSPEVSVLLSVQKGMVREDLLGEAKDGCASQWGNYREGVDTSYDVLDFSENGVVDACGDPTQIDVNKGEKIYSAAKESLSNLVSWLKETELQELLAKPHK